MSRLYEEIYKLKNILRKGWLMRGAKDAETGRVESDAEHTFSMAILAIEIMQKENLQLDELKVIKMVLFHELCEIDAGDHTPFEDLTKEQKFKMEKAGVERIARECEMPEILQIWLEFEKGETHEAKFVKAVDKLDAIMQSKIYGGGEKSDLFNEFFNYSKNKIGPFKKHL